MPRTQEYVFVLWGNRFEEVAATIFVAELRQAGLRVKVVSLTRRRVNGAHGLALLPDLTLEEALPLAGQASCLIIPCHAAGLKRLASDPRLRDFFSQLHANKAIIVTCQAAVNSGVLSIPLDQVVVYPDSEDLMGFAREVAGRLA